MAMIKRVLPVLAIFVSASLGFCSEWYQKNRDLSAVFHRNVWSYVEQASGADDGGRLKEADFLLRRAETKIDEVKPFLAGSWPSGWPQDGKTALRLLEYATPDAYLYRIIGDYAYSHKRTKEALVYYEKYILYSVVPDTDYMAKVADIYQGQGRLHDATVLYENIFRVTESGNFHGTKLSLNYVAGRIKNLKLKLKKPKVLPLDIFYVGIQDYAKSDLQQMFVNKIAGMKGFSVILRKDFDRTMTEEKLTKEDLQYPDELSNLAKILNADYILRPSLALIDDYYIFHTDVFDPSRKIWFESYEYKTESQMYIANLMDRFTCQFQNMEIPAGLLLPENEFLWDYEVDSAINDLKISSGGQRIIAGCESGTVYIFNGKGRMLKKFDMSERIVKVAISPCGNFYSWLALDGNVFFAEEASRGVKWSDKLGNQGRDLDISKDGRFVVIGINDEVIFKDRKGEVFWRESVPQWATKIEISEDSHRVFVGMESGAYWCFSDEGNVLWKKNLGSRIIDIKTSDSNYSCAVNNAGKTYIFDAAGNEIISFDAGKEIQYSVFRPEVIELLAGRKDKYVYLLSSDKKQLWEYSLGGKINFIDALPDGRFICTVEGKNIFTFRIVWK